MIIDKRFYNEHRQLLHAASDLLGPDGAQEILLTKVAERDRLAEEISESARTRSQPKRTFTSPEEFRRLAYYALRLADELNRNLLIDTDNGTITLTGPSLSRGEAADAFVLSAMEELLSAPAYSCRTIERYGETLSEMTFFFNILG